MSLNLFKKSLEESPVIKKGDYQYFVNPITDGIPELQSQLLDEVVNEMQRHIEKCGKIDKIVTIEAMGIPLATALSLKMNIPFVVIRKRKYGLPGEVVVEQKTGYSKSKLYINGLVKGDKVVIVDDVISTGGTLRSVLSAFKKMNIVVKGVFIAVDKGKNSRKLVKEFGINVESLINVEIDDGRVIII